MSVLTTMLLGAGLALAQGHPLSDCEAQRGSVTYNSTVTLFCGPAQVGVRRYPRAAPVDARLEQFQREMSTVAGALEAELTWHTGTIEIGGGSRKVAQYTLKKDGATARVGLVAPEPGTSSDLVECSSGSPDAATGCKSLVDTVIRLGLPGGLEHLPFPADIERTEVLGTPVRVELGCKAQWVFEDAVHVACTDGEMMFGARSTIVGEGLKNDPIATVQEQFGGASAGEETACTVAGESTTCWTATAHPKGSVPRTAWTAQVPKAGEQALFVCIYTKAGTRIHPQCERLLDR